MNEITCVMVYVCYNHNGDAPVPKAPVNCVATSVFTFPIPTVSENSFFYGKFVRLQT